MKLRVQLNLFLLTFMYYKKPKQPNHIQNTINPALLDKKGSPFHPAASENCNI